MERINVNSVRINYDVSGRGKAWLVFLHGLGMNLHIWDEQINFFGPSYRLLRLDFRGFGASEKPQDEHHYSIDRFARDLLAILDQEHIAKAHLLGTSMGGYVAQQFAITFPERVESLILCHTACRRGVTAEVMRVRLEALEKMNMASYAELVAQQALGSKASPEIFSLVRDILAHNSKHSYRIVTAGHVLDFDLCDELKNIRVPVLVISGSEDRVVPVERSQEIHKRLPQSQMVCIEEAGHLSYLESPREFNEALSEFLHTVKTT